MDVGTRSWEVHQKVVCYNILAYTLHMGKRRVDDPTERETRLQLALEKIRDEHDDAGEDQGYGPDGYDMLSHTCSACGWAGEFAVEWPCWERNLIDEALA